MTNTVEEWPAGQTYVFQGTVAEDATAGTHVCSLTVTPGAGNELQLSYGQLTVGNTATAQTAKVQITDGTNVVGHILNPQANSNTAANEVYIFPQISNTAALIGTNTDILGPTGSWMVSGTMQLLLSVTTTAISVTHAFAIVGRLKGALPTATLADTVGTPTLVTNTNRVF